MLSTVYGYYGYIRVSTTIQEETHSLETQEYKIKEKFNNDVKIFKDVKSGADIDRPGLQEMLKNLKKGDTIIVNDMSRLTRNAKQGIAMLENFMTMGCKFICLEPYMEYVSTRDKFVSTLLMAHAEIERKTTSQLVSNTLQILSKEGKLRTVPPFGYKFVAKDKDYERVESQQRVIKKIIDMFAKENTADKIAKMLNEEGENIVLLDNKPEDSYLRKKDPPKFYGKTVRRILMNEGVLIEREGRKSMEERTKSRRNALV